MASTIRISILADAANAVRGLRTTGAEANRTGRQLTSLQRQVARLEAQNVNINVKAKGFKQAVAEIVTANLALDRIRKGLPDLSFGLTGVANKLALIAAGALAATAASLPLVAAMVAIGAALGGAALGVGLFAAVALPTFKAVTTAVGEYNTASHAYDRAKSIGDTKAMTKAQKQMASSLGALTPMQRAAALQTIAMNKAWDALSNSAAPTVLRIISTAAGTLARIIPRLTPAIDAMAKAFEDVSSDAFEGLSKSVTPIVGFITGQGAPAFTKLAAIIGNLLVVVGHIATAFAPLGNVILARLTPLTAALRSINFDALAKSASTLLPLVGRLLGNLGGALGNLVKSAAPLAGPVLKGLGDIAGILKAAFGGPEIKQFVANIAKIVPAVAPIIAVLVPTFLKFADIVSGQLVLLVPKLLPLVQQMADVFVNVLTGVSPLLAPLLDLVGVLVSFLPVIFPIVTALREALIPVVKTVGAALIQLQPSVAIVIGALATLLQPVSQIIVALLKIVPVLVTALIPAFTVVATTIGQVLTALLPMFPVLTRIVEALSAGLQPVISALGAALPQIVTALEPLIQSLLDIAVAALPIIPPLSKLAVALVQALLPSVLLLTPALVQVADVIAKAMPAAIAVLTPVLSALTWLVGSPVFQVFQASFLAILALVGAVKALSLVFKFLWAAAVTVVGWFRNLRDATVAVFGTVQTFFLALANAIIDFRNRVVATVSGLIQRFKDIASAIIQGFIDGVRAGFDKVRGVFTDLTDKIASWKGPPARDAKLLHDNGKLILGSLINGIRSQVPALKSQLAGVSSLIQGGVAAKANVDLSATGRVPVTALAASGAAAPGIIININVAQGADPAEAGRQAVSAIEAYERRTGRRRLMPVTVTP